jgi:glycosyltransferase involved in cell wall biosynthesis
LGKTWACQRLADNATGDVLVFVDADVVLTPDAVAACVQLLQQQDAVDAVCPYPRQICDSIAERLVQPLLQWSWLTFLPLKPAESSSRPSLTAANGQLLAITRASYDRVGGHAAVRSAVMEDVGLFRALKRVHGRGVIADGSALATCRMYDGWRTLRVGYSKSLWAAFGSNKAAFLAAAGLTLLYVLPPLAMLKGSRVGAVGYASAVVGRVVVARRTGGRAWPDAAAHPISITVFAYLTSHSVHKRAQGTLQWKGRPLTTVSGFGDNLERA